MASYIAGSRSLLLLAALCAFAPQGRARGTPAPKQTPAPAAIPEEIWTSESISQGGNQVAGGFAAEGGPANRFTFESSSSGATFVNPKPGQLVYPGETLHIDLAIAPHITLVKGMSLINSRIGISNEIREAPPYSFTLSIPVKDEPGNGGPLIGLQTLYAFGAVAGRPNDPDLATTTIDVEEPDLPLSLFFTGESIPYSKGLNFLCAGDDYWVKIYARFPNGRERDVSKSTYLQLASSDTAILRVADDNWVIAMGPGKAYAIATYMLKGQQKQLLIPVSVPIWDSVLTIDPAVVDFLTKRVRGAFALLTTTYHGSRLVGHLVCTRKPFGRFTRLSKPTPRLNQENTNRKPFRLKNRPMK
jgi:hypothetical protein